MITNFRADLRVAIDRVITNPSMQGIYLQNIKGFLERFRKDINKLLEW